MRNFLSLSHPMCPKNAPFGQHLSLFIFLGVYKLQEMHVELKMKLCSSFLLLSSLFLCVSCQSCHPKFKATIFLCPYLLVSSLLSTSSTPFSCYLEHVEHYYCNVSHTFLFKKRNLFLFSTYLGLFPIRIGHVSSS